MNKILSIFILVELFTILAFAQGVSYKPYPIIYVHGLNGNPSNWGVIEHFPGDTTKGWTIYGNIHDPDSTDITGREYLIHPPNKPHTIYSFKENYFERNNNPYDPYYPDFRYPPKPETTKYWFQYPHHIFQEVIAMVPNNGSLDPEGSDIGQGAKVWHKVEQTLREYYGPDWQNNPDAKVILVCHSAGGLATRQAIYQFGNSIKPHIAKIITLGTPHKGANPAALGWLASCFLTVAATAPMLAGICGQGIVAIAISASETLFPLLFEFGGATIPMVRDLSGLTGFMDNLNSSFQGGGYTWHCLVGKQGWYWAEPLGGAMITLGVILSAQLNPIGPVLIADGGFIIYWDANSDGVVETYSQNLNNVNPAYNAEVLERDIPAESQIPMSSGWTAHSAETSQWEVIRDFLEPPVWVSIDSAVVFKDGARTAFALPNVSDTIKAPGDSIFLKGRTNCYFLAQADAKISLNGSGYLTMHWPSALGREGQGFFFRVPDQYLFVPENYIEVKIKSVDSDAQTNTAIATTRLYYNPWAIFVYIENPPINAIYRFPEFVPIKVSFSKPAPKDSISLYYQIPDDTTFHQIPGDSFTYIPGILNDTLKIDFTDGRYLIKVGIRDGDKSYATVWPFFVDNTPPEVVITSPHLEGGELMVYSPNADSIMPVTFVATDNLQWYFPNPPDKKATVEILDSLKNVLYTKEAEDVWFGQGCRVWVRLDSINFTYDGKYYAKVSISDKAGNDTTAIDSFLIDTTPPEITVIQPLEPNPFTYDDPCMTFIFTTNEWTEIFLKYTRISAEGEKPLMGADNGEVYERSLLFPYWDIDTNGVRDTLYIVESENWYGGYLPDGHYLAQAWAKDKAGNRIEIEGFIDLLIDSLIVDKTRPIIKDCYCQPFVVKRDSAWTTLYFKQNESEDVQENRKGLTAKIYLDTSFIETTSDTSYQKCFDVSALSNGPHTFRIESYDWVGNKSFYSAQFVKGSLGSEITYPAEGDSNLAGIIVIKGWASDPNLENSEPFGKYEIHFKSQIPSPKYQTNSNSQIPNIQMSTDEILKRVQNDKRGKDEIASPPNLENSEPFAKYELFFTGRDADIDAGGRGKDNPSPLPSPTRGEENQILKRVQNDNKNEISGEQGWSSLGIWVPEGYREPGGPQNRSIKEVVINSTIGYWDMRNLPEGDYILRLTTYEKGTESLSVVYRNVRVKGGPGEEIAIDTVILSIKGGGKAQEGSKGQDKAIGGGLGKFMGLGSNPGQRGDTIDSVSFYADPQGNYSVELQILTGMNKIFIFDGRVKDYMKTRGKTFSWPTGVKTNCAVAYTFLELDTIPHLEIVGERNPVIDHIFDTERIRVWVDKFAQVYYSRYDLQGQLDESQIFAVEPYETLSIWWDGKDRYGNYAGNGEWWYRVYAKDEFGRVSNEEQGYFLVARGVPIEIVAPQNNSKNAGVVNLRAEITNGGDYPVSWKFYNQFWGNIGTQPHPGIDFPWDTRQVYDGRGVLVTATSVDPLGNIGSDTISIMIDNTPPEIFLTKGAPSYDKYIRWQTQLTLTSIDTLAGVFSSRYRVDAGNWNDFYNSVQFNLDGYAQGAHILNTEARDSLQNLKEKTFDLFIDEMVPLIGFEVGQPSNYYNGIWYLSSRTPINLWGKDSLYQNDGAGIGLVKYSIDNGPWQTENDSVATIYLIEDGWHKVLYQTVDRVANISPIKIDSFYVDNYPPVTEIHIGEPKYGEQPVYITSNTSIWFTATDSGVGVWYTEYSVGDTLQWITYEEPFTIGGIPDGLHKIFYRSVDYAGNIEQTKEKIIFLDNTPPEITIEIGEPKYGEEPVYLRKFTEIKITASDAGCGVDSARYKIEPGDWNYFVNFVQFDLQGYEEGLHNFFTFAIDHLGNNQEIIKILAIDETPPHTDLTIGEPNYPLPGDSVLITSQTPLDLLAYDIWSNGVASGVDHLACRFTYLGQLRAIGGNLGQIKGFSPTSYFSLLAFPEGEWVIIPDSAVSLRCEGPDGWYLFEYYAQDHVKNREEINSKNLVLDNTPPEGTIISPLDSTLVNRTIKIIGTATDPHFALYQVYYGAGWNPNQWILIKESNIPVVEGVLAEWNTDLLSDGRYTIRLVVKDLVNNQTEDRVLLIVGEPQYSFEITGFNKCEGVAVDEAGYVYVADRNSNPIQEHNRIAKFDPYGNLVLNIFDVRKPNGVDVDDYGNIYASEWAGDCITKFSPAGESLMTILGFNKPNGVAVDKLQQIYIADQNNNRIVRTDKEGNINLIITGLGHPEGVDCEKTQSPRMGAKNDAEVCGGKIYTTDTENGKIKVFDKQGNLVLEFGEGLNQPADIEADSRGYMWVVDRNNNRILCYDFFGNRLLDFGTIGSGPGEFNKPEGIAVSEIPGGVVKEVFVADRNNDRVCKFIIPYLIEPEASIMKMPLASPGLEITEAVAYPSPYDPNKGLCRIRVVLTGEADVKLTIYTIAGKVVYRDEIFSGSGIIEFVWDGRNEIGEMVNNGVYGFLIQARNGNEYKEKEGKFIVMKQ